MVKLGNDEDMNETKELDLFNQKIGEENRAKLQVTKSRNQNSDKKRIISTMKNKRLFAKVHK